MKTLTIVRHAKAERPEGYAHDADRPLTDRGLRDAGRLGELLGRLDPPVDWWISSPAKRTRQTTEQMIAAAKISVELQWEPAVYEASCDTLLELLSNVPPSAEHTVLVGHNPGMAEVVAGLVAGGPGKLGLHMATGALVHMTLELFWWNQIRWGCGRLEMMVTPKALKK